MTEDDPIKLAESIASTVKDLLDIVFLHYPEGSNPDKSIDEFHISLLRLVELTKPKFDVELLALEIESIQTEKPHHQYSHWEDKSGTELLKEAANLVRKKLTSP